MPRHTLVKGKQAVKQLSGRDQEHEVKKPRVTRVLIHTIKTIHESFLPFAHGHGQQCGDGLGEEGSKGIKW